MTTKAGLLGAKRTTRFLYQKLELSSIAIYRNGRPIAGRPLTTDTDKRNYLSSLEALACGQQCHSIPYSEYSNHHLMVFDPTVTAWAPHVYPNAELTDAALSIPLRFSTALATNTQLFFLGEESSTIHFDFARRFSKNIFFNTKIHSRKW